MEKHHGGSGLGVATRQRRQDGDVLSITNIRAGRDSSSGRGLRDFPLMLNILELTAR